MLPAGGAAQAGGTWAMTPVPMHEMVPSGFIAGVVLAPHMTLPTQWPATMTAPLSVSQSMPATPTSAATQVRLPSSSCTCLVPGPHVGVLQPPSAATATASDARNCADRTIIPASSSSTTNVVLSSVLT